MCLGFKLQENKKVRGGFPPPYTLGQLEVNNQVGVSDLDTCFEGCLEADFIVVFAEPNRELLLVAQKVRPVEEVTEVRRNDAVRASQAGDCNDTDVCAGIHDVPVSKASQVNLVIQDVSG